MNRTGVVQRITDDRVIAILRLTDADTVHDTVHALISGGIRILELTMTVPNALAIIERLAGSVPESVILGVGTVLDSATAIAAIGAGARFIVSPVCRPALITECHRRDAVMMPGCLTPTEILTAWDAGADFVKVFPASVVGPSFIRDVRAPLPQVRLIPTGGIGPDNAAAWLGAGAAAIGVGGALLEPNAIRSRNVAAITASAERLVAAVAAVARPQDGRSPR